MPWRQSALGGVDVIAATAAITMPSFNSLSGPGPARFLDYPMWTWGLGDGTEVYVSVADMIAIGGFVFLVLRFGAWAWRGLFQRGDNGGL